MRQINTIIERTPEDFDAQVNAVIQEIGSGTSGRFVP
jgi:hypothetical protein